MSSNSNNRSVAYRAVFLVWLMVLSTAVIGVGSVGATTASGTPTVDASAGDTTYTVGGSGVAVDPAIVVSDTSGGTYDGARVVIQNLQAGDQLAFTDQHGISGSYDGSTGVLTLSGTATAVEYQAVFRSVTYSSSASSPDLSDRQISFSIGAILPNDDNGHFYEFVPADDITWTEARDDAASRTLYGLQGYLVTVTSAEENTFVASKLQGQGWLGASDSASEGTWTWVTGPETGTHFSNQDKTGACSANTIHSGVGGQYVNWQAGEPNDCGGEDYAHFRTNGEWNDYPDLVGSEHDIQGYVVEYGGMAGDPAATWSDTKTVVVDETPVVTTSAGDTAYPLGGPAVTVDPSITAEDANGDSFDGARVVIQNLHPDDVLAFTADHGITGSYASSSGVLTLSGTATAAQYQDVFRSVTFQNANTGADVTDRRITFALGSTLPSDATGHFYEYVSAGGISWHDANAAASATSYLGLQGYLATVTSQEENEFIAQKLQGNGWIGASDDVAFSYIEETSEGYDQWHWVTGPEAGTHFWTGDVYEAVSQPASGEYANWAPNEPNDYLGGADGNEDYAHFYHNSGQWNDFPGTASVDGYVVEYGGFGGESEITWRDTKTVAIDEPPVVETSAGVTTYEAGNAPAVVDPDVLATDDEGSIDGARVVIQNAQPGDTLSFSGQHGITGSFDSLSGVLTLNGPATAAEFQDVFRSVTFSNTLTSPDPSDRRITFALGASIPFDGTGHYYEYVDAGAGITWHDANAAASARTYFGLQGYLVTLTSQGENDFVAQKIQGNTWIGASDDTAHPLVSEDANGNDRWFWVTGPEAGTHFWTGDAGEGFTCDADGCGDPVPGQYSNWVGTPTGSEPNDAGGDGNENYAHFWFSVNNKWNDLPGSTTGWVDAYVVEYGGLATDPVLSLQDTKVVEVKVNSPPTADGNGPYTVDEGGSVQLNGSGSSDPDGDSLTYAWDLDNDGQYDDATVSNPTFSAAGLDGPASHTVGLRVTDDEGATDTATATVDVLNVAPSIGVNVDSGNTVYYVDWTAADPSGGTASGVINLPNGDTVSLTFEALNPDGSYAPYFGAQTSGGTNYWIPDDPYISTEVPNAPPDADILQLSGTNGVTYRVTLSEPIVDPIMAIVSLGAPTDPAVYDFDAPYTIVSQGVGYFGGTGTGLSQLPGDALQGYEAHGTIKFLGTYNTFSWTVPDNEVWHGFTFAIRTTASLGNTDVPEGETATNSGTWTDPGPGGDGVVVTATGEDGNPIGAVDTNPDGTWAWSFDTSDGPTESQTVTVTATDKDGASSSETFDLTVENVAPTVTASASPQTIDEGSSTTLSASFTDPGADTHTVTVDWGDGSPVATVTPSAGSISASHTYAEDGAYTVTVTVTDDDGGVGTATADVTVENVAPTITTADATSPIDEGSATALSGAFTDPGVEDTHTASIDWGDGSTDTVTASAGSFSASHVYADDGPYTVAVTVTDDEGGTDTTTLSVEVDNVAPSVTATGDAIDEGDAATVSATFTDPGADTHTAIIDWGDGTSESVTASGGSVSGSHVYAEDGSYTATVTVTDDDGGVGTATAAVEVANVAPSASATGDAIDEGDAAAVTGEFTDPGVLDTHTASIDWGDSSPVESMAVTQGAGSGSLSASHVYAEDGTYTVSVTVTDDEGDADTATATVEVANVAPTIDSTDVDDAANEGDIVSATGAFSDPGVLDTHTVEIDWGDGTTASASVTQGAGSGSYAADHVYADDGTYTVTMTVTDDEGDSTTATETIVVSNVAPSLTASADDTGVEDTPISLSADFTDPGTADTHTAVVDWGDGTSESVTVAQGAGFGSLDTDHVYTTGGIYTITVTVTDDDGGSDTVTETITVAHHETIEVMPDEDDPAGTDRNPINLRSGGVTPVALYGTAEFDVSTVDVSTVRFGDPDDVDAGAGASPAHSGHLEDVNDDGILDLVVHFPTQDLGFEDGDTVGKMVGLTDAGVPFFGTDDVDAFMSGGGGADTNDAEDDEDDAGDDDEGDDDEDDDDNRGGRGRGR